MRHTAARLSAATAVLALGALAALPAAAQVIEITPKSYDFGTMQQQETRETFITVTNKGGGLLELKDVHADCGCTVPTLTVDQLAPGESTRIDVTFNSKRFHGNVVKTVQITSNDPVNPVVDFMITADVQTSLIISPASQRLGFTREVVGSVQSDRITFEATNQDKLEISAGDTRKGIFHVRAVNDLDGDPRKAALEVTLGKDAPAGMLHDRVRVKTNVPDNESVDIDLAASRYDLLTASPAEVNFRYKSRFKIGVRVAPEGDLKAFKITGAEIDLPEIKVVVDETIPNKETMIRLTGAPVAADDPRAVATHGRIEGTLTIHTDLPELPTLTVPVRYMVRL